MNICLLMAFCAVQSQAASLQRPTFEKLDIELTDFDVGRWDLVFGIAPGHRILQYTGQGWLNIGGSLEQVSVGCNGGAVGVNGEGGLYAFGGGVGKHAKWTAVPGLYKSVSLGSMEHLWAVGEDGAPYRWQNGAFEKMPGELASVSVGCDGAVWGLDDSGRVLRWAPDGASGNWVTMKGRLAALSVAKNTVIYGLDQQHRLVRWQGKAGWQDLGGRYARLSASEDGAIWVKDFSDNVWRTRAFGPGEAVIGNPEAAFEPPVKRPDETARLPSSLKDLMKLMNKERERAGLPDLSANPALNRTAEEHAVHLAGARRLDTEPGGKSLPQRTEERGYALAHGEQFQGQSKEGAKAVFEEWFRSNRFRAVLYDGRILDVGLGEKKDASGNFWLGLILAEPAK